MLFLGSFPGEASLAAGQYYAHPRNHFWRLLGQILEMPLEALPYENRIDRLRQQRIGLWDTIVACERAGSLDGSIRDPQWGEVAAAVANAPRLELVAFNGQTAARALPRWRAAGLATVVLPSSSPAYTLPFAAKLAAWRGAIEPVRRERERTR